MTRRATQLWLTALALLCVSTVRAADVWTADSDSLAPLQLPPLGEENQQAAKRGSWTLGALVYQGYLLHGGPDIKKIVHSYNTTYYDLRLQWQAGETCSPYDLAMNRPRLQAGLMYCDYSHIDVYQPQTPYRSRIGRIWALYGGMQVDFWRHGRWGLGINLQNGIGYCPYPFDEHTNTDQWVIGSRFTIFVNLGLQMHYQLSPRWGLTLGTDFKHFSNGSLDRPNLGANTVGVSVGVEWTTQTPPHPSPRGGRDDSFPEGHYTPLPWEGQGEGLLEGTSSFYLDFVAGMGMRALIDRFAIYHESHSPIYAFPNILIAPMWRWNLLHATGIGIDYSYLDYVYQIRNYDQIRKKTPRHGYSPHVLGLSLRHEVFYKQLSLNVGIGWNIYKHLGYTSEIEESWLFQHVGLRYSFPFTRNRLFLGFNIKAHRFGKVDCVQLTTGWRLGKK